MTRSTHQNAKKRHSFLLPKKAKRARNELRHVRQLSLSSTVIHSVHRVLLPRKSWRGCSDIFMESLQRVFKCATAMGFDAPTASPVRARLEATALSKGVTARSLWQGPGEGKAMQAARMVDVIWVLRNSLRPFR